MSTPRSDIIETDLPYLHCSHCQLLSIIRVVWCLFFARLFSRLSPYTKFLKHFSYLFDFPFIVSLFSSLYFLNVILKKNKKTKKWIFLKKNKKQGKEI